MGVWKGNTATATTVTANNISVNINSFSLANKSGGSITASVGVVYGSTVVYILYTKSISSGDSYIYTGGKIELPPNYGLYIAVSGSCDYYFSFL